MLTKPVFIYSTIRAGSTLLRCILNSNKRIVAPHELHFCLLDEQDNLDEFLLQSLNQIGISKRDLKAYLWDYLYYSILQNSHKELIVDKTPSNIFYWKFINKYWADSKFIFLLRNPMSIYYSIKNLNDGRTDSEIIEYIINASKEMNEALKETSNSYIIRYEDIIQYPEKEISNLCHFLGVEYENEMLNYSVNHKEMVYGLGDFGDYINSGRIQNNFKKTPFIEQLIDISKEWGYHP